VTAAVMTDDEQRVDSFAAWMLLALGFVLGFPVMLLRAYTASLVWAWLVSAFTGAPRLPLAAFVGLSCVWNVLRFAGETHAEKAARQGKSSAELMLHVLNNQVAAVIGCFITLGIAWLWFLWFRR
jgi:uncharacterized membrane protein SpoIIM required for sporulation